MSLWQNGNTLEKEVTAFSNEYIDLENDSSFQDGQNYVIGLSMSLSKVRRGIDSAEDLDYRRNTATQLIGAEGNTRLGALQTLKIIIEDSPESGSRIISYLSDFQQSALI